MKIKKSHAVLKLCVISATQFVSIPISFHL